MEQRLVDVIQIRSHRVASVRFFLRTPLETHSEVIRYELYKCPSVYKNSGDS